MGAGVYTLKLEFPDGRWSVDEKLFDETPCVGELLELGVWWKVLRVDDVPVWVAHKPDRELFVCAQALRERLVDQASAPVSSASFVTVRQLRAVPATPSCRSSTAAVARAPWTPFGSRA